MRSRRVRRCRVRNGFDIQKWMSSLGVEFHWPGYNYMGAGTHLKKRLKRGDTPINRLDRLAFQHDVRYGMARRFKDKKIADKIMIKEIEKFTKDMTWTEWTVHKILKAKVALNI